MGRLRRLRGVTVCADCGAEIEQVPWAEKLESPKWAKREPYGLSFTCRCVNELGPPLRCLSADYHYVEGEEQRRWRLDD